MTLEAGGKKILFSATLLQERSPRLSCWSRQLFLLSLSLGLILAASLAVPAPKAHAADSECYQDYAAGSKILRYDSWFAQGQGGNISTTGNCTIGEVTATMCGRSEMDIAVSMVEAKSFCFRKSQVCRGQWTIRIMCDGAIMTGQRFHTMTLAQITILPGSVKVVPHLVGYTLVRSQSDAIRKAKRVPCFANSGQRYRQYLALPH